MIMRTKLFSWLERGRVFKRSLAHNDMINGMRCTWPLKTVTQSEAARDRLYGLGSLVLSNFAKISESISDKIKTSSKK